VELSTRSEETKAGMAADLLVPAAIVDLAPQEPEVERLVVDRRYGNTWVALLLVITVKLLEKIEFGARSGLDRVERHDARLESKRLRAGTGLCVSYL
jgi:hypothetical protein